MKNYSEHYQNKLGKVGTTETELEMLSDIEMLEKELAASRDSRQLSAVPSEEAWLPIDVVKKLVEATDILLYQKDYDGHGLELITTANNKAKKFLTERGIAG